MYGDEIEFVDNCSGRKWKDQLDVIEQSIEQLSDQVALLTEAAHTFGFADFFFFLDSAENRVTSMPEGDFEAAYRKAADHCFRAATKSWAYPDEVSERHLVVCFDEKAAKVIAEEHCWAIERVTTFLVNDGDETDWTYWKDARDSGGTHE